MTDLTYEPESNSMQVLVNTWIEGSYSPVHRHNDYSETFIILDGALAFFVFSDSKGDDAPLPTCHILSSSRSSSKKAIVVEKNQYHAMTAAPQSLGYPGFAVVFENSGHIYSRRKPTKELAPFAPSKDEGQNGDKQYFDEVLLKTCNKPESSST